MLEISLSSLCSRPGLPRPAGVWATVTSFAPGQHASSEPVRLELNSSSFSGRRACLFLDERKGRGRREEASRLASLGIEEHISQRGRWTGAGAGPLLSQSSEPLQCRVLTSLLHPKDKHSTWHVPWSHSVNICRMNFNKIKPLR